jgi:hypothetical protein
MERNDKGRLSAEAAISHVWAAAFTVPEWPHHFIVAERDFDILRKYVEAIPNRWGSPL